MTPTVDLSNYTDAVIAEYDSFSYDQVFKVLSRIELGTRILENADQDFLVTAYEIESCGNVVKQQQLAFEFINNHPEYPKKLQYSKLKTSLTHIKTWKPEYCRHAYMLQYSIPLIKKHRESNYRPYNWIQRIMVFTNTYIVENTVVRNFWNGYKFLFRTKGKNKVVDHSILEYGPGEELPDFYFWDKPANKLFASVDLKCNFNTSTIEEVVELYSAPASRHYARFVLAYMHNEATYYMIDYNASTPVWTGASNIPLPSGLYDIYNF